jgi:vacuolar-type H+-ATPase subunit D/Vma8
MVGPDWAPEDDAGHLSLGQRLQDAQAWLDDQGYSVVVEDVQIDPEGGYRWKIYGEFYNPRFAKKDQGVAEGAEEDSEKIKGFHQSLGNAIRGRVSQMQANMAILKAQHPDTWLWEPGDIVYSTKTGRTYKIVGPWIDSLGTAKYLYQCNDVEKGTFVADKAHKTLKKLSEDQEITEIANRRKEATLRIQKMLNDKFNANLDVDGILGPLTIASINKFMPNAKVKLADEPNRTTAVQGNKMKKENVNLESSYGDQYNVNKTTSVSLAKELNDMVLELGELIAASPKHPSINRLKDKIVALNQELNDLGYDYDPQAENFLTPITLDMRNLHEGICPKCKGSIVAEIMINEKQDSCYYKVKSRYKVWPSAYASGALVQCRKKGAKNWGKKNESKNVNENKIYFSIPKSLANETELRESFNLRHDAKGWYLKEGQENFKKSYKNALKACPVYKDTSEGFDMSKGTGSAPIKGDDFVLSPVGSIPKNKK